MAFEATRGERRISPVFLALVAIMAVSIWAVWTDFAANAGFPVFLFVTSAWIVSLCLHEYAHARTALHGGDISVEARGYLTLNPLAYTHALLSIVLPVIFVIMGGIGLPGGAVFIERHRIRSRWKHSLISAAGPLTNVVFALVVSAPFWLDALDGVPENLRYALGFLALLQVTAAILNFLPVPGLDGYGVIEPWLPYGIRRQLEPFAPFGLLAVFGFLWIPEVNHAFFDMIDAVLRALGVSDWDTFYGQRLFRFWEGNPIESLNP
ncbi:site-2 protease family protein [Streptomyces griseocarneus]|uniref:site-2 protease family protein n=1 Tax=Streptomyces griseocarneus TaxID=51201 RepID=UPI00167E4ECB|nr:site-2 protease family protein [Streptomyces griseocarneus]MBZ6472117.1 site-2 protease family protein [Streptomyces griseocarneus]GHG73738.1 site-2 protease family protein [Streptomyces griseocarneus]